MNKENVAIFPSVMCCKPWDLLGYLQAFEQAGVRAIHFDVMDGHYVPNIMLGADDFSAIRSKSSLPLDVHLMCTEPESFIPYFELKEGDYLSFHPEVCKQPYRLLESLKGRGIRAGLAMSPAIPLGYIEECLGVLDFILVMAVSPGFAGQKMVPDHLDKLKRIKAIIEKADHPIEIIVDGNTTPIHGKMMYNAGATGLVVGTSSLIKGDVSLFTQRFREYVEAVQS